MLVLDLWQLLPTASSHMRSCASYVCKQMRPCPLLVFTPLPANRAVLRSLFLLTAMRRWPAIGDEVVRRREEERWNGETGELGKRRKRLVSDVPQHSVLKTCQRVIFSIQPEHGENSIHAHSDDFVNVSKDFEILNLFIPAVKTELHHSCTIAIGFNSHLLLN